MRNSRSWNAWGGKKIAILWYAREGKSSLQWLLRRGVDPSAITVLDKKELTEDILNELKGLGVQVIMGQSYLQELELYDVIFRTPGITTHIIETEIWPLSQQIRDAFTSQTQVFFDLFGGIVIGVTGTKGKSTTSSFIYEMLKKDGKNVVLAGNVWKPVLDQIDFDAPPEIVVYELSSFMVESLGDFGCDIGILTTLIPVHIKEHGDYERYVAAKIKLLQHSKHAFVGTQAREELERLWRWQEMKEGLLAWTTIEEYGKSGTYVFVDGYFQKNNTQNLCTDEGMQLLGAHNRYNLCAALGICDYLNLPIIAFEEALRSFKGLEHRLEFVGVYGGVKRYNDAIATSPLATQAAMEAFGEELDTIFLGGIEWTYDFTDVIALIDRYHVRNVLLFPDTWARIKLLLETQQTSSNNTQKYNFFETRSMADAVHWAARVTAPGKVALLSCGSPSFSVWSWFEEKGRLFKEAVMSLC